MTDSEEPTLIRKLMLTGAVIASITCSGEKISGPPPTPGQVGEVKLLASASSQGQVQIPAASDAADYLVITANLNPVTDTVASYSFKSEGNLLAASQSVANSVSALTAPAVDGSASDLGAMQINFETRLRLTERRELNLSAARAALRNRTAPAALRYAQSVAVPAVGDRTSYKVPAQNNPCTQFTTITAEVKYVNDKVIIYSDITSPAGGFTLQDYQQIGDEFSTLIYPTDVSYFGTPLDEDNNGRIIILYTPEVNKLTPAGNPSSFVGGFFWAGDLFPTTGTNSCAQSNNAELFYVLAPDPTGAFNGNIRNTTQVRQGTRGTIAHEFQHMINASERIRSPIEQDFEEVWLDEGLAHFAEDAVGRVVRALGEADDATFSRTLGGNVDDFNAFFFQNFARLRLYLKDPGPMSPTSSLADTSLAVRGAAWALVHYAADQYAPGGDIKAFTRKLAGGPDVGVANLTKNASGVKFDVLISGFLVANYADNLGIANLNPLYTYKVYDMRSNERSLPSNGNTYPLKVTTITSPSFTTTGTIRSGSGSYFFVSNAAGATAKTFKFLNSDGSTPASFTGASWILLRTK